LDEIRARKHKSSFGSSFKQLYHRLVDKYQILKKQKKSVPLIYDNGAIFLAEWLHRALSNRCCNSYSTSVEFFVYNWLENKKEFEF
jgi:hypothetical protein